jgi:protein involved in polysaccharide export with SLBB domain
MKFSYHKIGAGLAGLVAAVAVLLQPGCASEKYTWHPEANGVAEQVAHFHVGDTVIVTLTGLPVDIQPHQEPIKEDGTITMPDIGKVQAVGKTAGELQDTIHNLYVPAIYRRATVTVSVGDRVYYVRGEVKAPGRQVYLGEVTVTRAITSADVR